jgi:hypothetical protein
MAAPKASEQILKDLSKVQSDRPNKEHRKKTSVCSRCGAVDDGRSALGAVCGFKCDTPLCGKCKLQHGGCLKCAESLHFKIVSTDERDTWTTEFASLHLTRAKLRSLAKATDPVPVVFELSNNMRLTYHLTSKRWDNLLGFEGHPIFAAHAELVSITLANGQPGSFQELMHKKLYVHAELFEDDPNEDEDERDRRLSAAGSGMGNARETQFAAKNDTDKPDDLYEKDYASELWLVVDVAIKQ